jgi:hypothetical protein
MSTCTTNSHFYNHINHSGDEYIVIRGRKPVEEVCGSYVISENRHQIEDLLGLMIAAIPTASVVLVIIENASDGLREALIKALGRDMPWEPATPHVMPTSESPFHRRQVRDNMSEDSK